MVIRKKIIIVAHSLLLILGVLSSQIATAESYVIIVNAANDYTAEPKKTHQVLRRLFLKESSFWPNKIRAFPVDRAEDSFERRLFMVKVLNTTQSKLNFHWLKLKQKTGEVSPPKANTTRSALNLVSSRKGAFSIIKENEVKNLPKTVRVLTRINIQ